MAGNSQAIVIQGVSGGTPISAVIVSGGSPVADSQAIIVQGVGNGTPLQITVAGGVPGNFTTLNVGSGNFTVDGQGNTVIAGNLTVNGNTTLGNGTSHNTTVGGNLTAGGNVTGGNVTTPGRFVGNDLSLAGGAAVINALGNVVLTGADIFTRGIVTTGDTAIGGHILVPLVNRVQAIVNTIAVLPVYYSNGTLAGNIPVLA